MFNLIPKEVRFFDYFEQQSQHIIRAAALLHEMVHNFGDARAKAHAIKEVEHQGDHTTHEIIKKLNTTFITPIDREDIHALVTRIDEHAVEVNRLENSADALLRDSLAALFDEQGDPIEVIKWKEIYETMEIVTDRCEDVANVIEGIILKMA